MDILKVIKLGTHGFKPADIKAINESGIDTDDVIKLAESGYSVNDVNELITLTKEENTESIRRDDVAVVPDNTDSIAREESKVDYTKELAEKNAEIEKLTKQVSMLQNANANRDRSGQLNIKSPRESLQEAIANIY